MNENMFPFKDYSFCLGHFDVGKLSNAEEVIDKFFKMNKRRLEEKGDVQIKNWLWIKSPRQRVEDKDHLKEHD